MRDHSGLTFTLPEYERRIRALRRRMEEAGLDLVMFNDPANLTYLTGYQTSGYGTFGALFVPLEGEPFTVTRYLEDSNVVTRTWVERSMPYRDTEKPLDKVKAALGEFAPDAKVVGLERNCYFLTHGLQEGLGSILQGKDVRDCTGILSPIRLIKSDEEIQLMKRAAAATEAGMEAGIEAVVAGATENDIAADAHHAMYKAGGEYPAVPPYITSGPRTLIGHATWEGRRLKKGDCVFLEMAGCVRRYHTAMMRTLYLGEAPPEVLEAEKIVNEDLDTLMGAMRPGITVGELDTLTRHPGRQEAIGATRISRTGYSIGIAYAPSWDEGHILSLNEGDGTPLQENMTFHLIPWLQLPGHNAVMGLSETLRITATGAESFFSMPRRLIVRG